MWMELSSPTHELKSESLFVSDGEHAKPNIE